MFFTLKLYFMRKNVPSCLVMPLKMQTECFISLVCFVLASLHPGSFDGRIGAEVRILTSLLLLWSLWWLTDFQCSVTHIFNLRFEICLQSWSRHCLMPWCIMFYSYTYLIWFCLTSTFRFLLINLRAFSCKNKNSLMVNEVCGFIIQKMADINTSSLKAELPFFLQRW